MKLSPRHPTDEEAKPPRRRSFARDGQHTMSEDTAKVGMCCIGLVALGGFIGIIILLCSIHTLGPEEQVVITGPSGKYVRNGPDQVILSPSRKKEFRQATRLGPREYAIIKNTRSGEPRHESGPKLLWLEAYDELQRIATKIILQLHEYTRMVDATTGAERVVVGPSILIPGVLEKAPNGTESAIVITAQTTILTMNKTTGMRKLITDLGVFTPAPYEVILEVRDAVLLGPREYARVKNNLNGIYRHELGPQLLKIGAYDTLISVNTKIVLQKDEFTVLKDQKTGAQRVVKGPTAFVPSPSETTTVGGIKKAAFLDTDTAILVLNRVTGQQRLVSKKGVFFPEADEQILEQRELIRVLVHEAIVVRDAQGKVTIHNGADGNAAFFLPPYTSIVTMQWSDFSAIPTGVALSEEAVKKSPISKIDLRTRKIFFSYEVPTNDNVRLRVDGTIFWKVSSVGKMLNTTSDPEGDVWHHSRSALISAVSKVNLAGFMSSFSNITADAYQMQAADGFYEVRGVILESMELTKFEAVDSSTEAILNQIIEETINRINRLQVQESSNEVQAAALSAEIQLEKQRTALITTKAINAKLQAAMQGDAAGSQVMRAAAAFIGGLNESVPDVVTRVELYSMHEKLASKNIDTANMAAGNGKLFLTPADINLNNAGISPR